MDNLEINQTQAEAMSDPTSTPEAPSLPPQPSTSNQNPNQPEQLQPPLRKAVSFPAAPQKHTPQTPSPATEKILSRKPTPFNNDLAAQIRKSGLGSVVPDDNPTPDPPVQPPPGDPPIIGARVEEVAVDIEDALRARRLSLAKQ